MSSSFRKLLVVTASTKRSPVVASGKVGAKVVNIASFLCSPIDPLEDMRYGAMTRKPILESPKNTLITYCDADLDIKQGDTLVVGSDEYPITYVNDWYWQGENFMELGLERTRV